LYRWRDEQWKERGVGNCKLMRDRANRKIRFLMRQEKTLKPVGNFIGKSHPTAEALHYTILDFDPCLVPKRDTLIFSQIPKHCSCKLLYRDF